MLSIWTHHIKDPEKKAKYESELRHSVSSYNERLREILRDMNRSLERQSESVQSYESPNWALRQADIIGYQRCINKLLTITDLDQKEPVDERPNSRQPGTVSIPV